MRVPCTAESVAVVRSALRRWLKERGLRNDAVEDARLVVSELVGNAVRHGRPVDGGDLLVEWALERGQLRISVTDGGGPSRPRAMEPAPTALSGRGLAIVHNLCDRWWHDRRGDRTTVHAVLGVN